MLFVLASSSECQTLSEGTYTQISVRTILISLFFFLSLLNPCCSRLVACLLDTARGLLTLGFLAK
jgi:hypothetical protein